MINAQLQISNIKHVINRTRFLKNQQCYIFKNVVIFFKTLKTYKIAKLILSETTKTNFSLTKQRFT